VNQSLGVPCVVPEAFGVADHTVVVPTALQLALERGESNHQPPPRAQCSNRHRRVKFIYPRLAQLLQTQPHLQGGAGIVSMDQAAGELVLLEAMEAATHAPPSPVGVGSRSRNSAHGDAEPQRLLADEQE
jgi:hypothetical protein